MAPQMMLVKWSRVGGLALWLVLAVACRTAPAPQHEAAHESAPASRSSGRVAVDPIVAIGPGAATTDVSDVVGKPAPSWDLATWFNGPPRKVEELRGSVVLVRWFMSSDCPYCSATAPNLVRLHETYGPRGLALVGMYHHKSEEPLVVADVQKLVQDHYHFEFPVAIDDDWSTLERYWLDAHPDSWTSVSFLIDRRGNIRFVHLGGEYPSGSADDQQMRRWIDLLLAEDGNAEVPAPATL